MTPKVHVGTILIEERPLIAQVLGLESEPYSLTGCGKRDNAS